MPCAIVQPADRRRIPLLLRVFHASLRLERRADHADAQGKRDAQDELRTMLDGKHTASRSSLPFILLYVVSLCTHFLCSRIYDLSLLCVALQSARRIALLLAAGVCWKSIVRTLLPCGEDHAMVRRQCIVLRINVSTVQSDIVQGTAVVYCLVLCYA